MILGTAFYNDPKDVTLFAKTLRRHYDGPVALVVPTGSVGLWDVLRDHEIERIFWDVQNWLPFHIQVGRYIAYWQYLRGREDIDKVLLTDVRDVVFQRDPLNDLPEGDLLCFMEDPRWTVAQANEQWVTDLYGPEGLKRIGHLPISCSGTTIGDRIPMLRYVAQMLSHVSTEVLAPFNGVSRGHDQGIHNYMLHTGELPYARQVENGNHVLTMALLTHADFCLEDGVVKTPDGGVPAIVHQYDRHLNVIDDRLVRTRPFIT